MIPLKYSTEFSSSSVAWTTYVFLAQGEHLAFSSRLFLQAQPLFCLALSPLSNVGLLLDMNTQVKVMVEVGKQVEEDNDPRHNHYNACTDFYLPYMGFEPFEHPAELI